jgi:hypothetical protein
MWAVLSTGQRADALTVIFVLATEAQVAGSFGCRKNIRLPTDTQSRAVACNSDDYTAMRSISAVIRVSTSR